ncbi:collagenase [Bacteroidia bacterium]|nr:collagenase [Bacteroidia bacterium]
MAPVGSYEALHAAIDGGADAVYFGIGNLNMRARAAHTFALSDMAIIVDICQRHKIRSYLTVNTVVFDDEIVEMKMLLDLAREAGVSAIIASDMAVITYAHHIGMEVHISTQCNITNIEAVRFFARYADVMVLAREVSLDKVAAMIQQIENEHITGPSGQVITIEIFAHGALCMAVSGKCYLSLDNYNESANRGLCLQLCRRPYKVFDTDGNTELSIDNAYIMSPKDLKTIDFIDKIIKAGVKVLKIEGRGRSADYVKTVTRIYKEAVEACWTNQFTPERLQQWNEVLKTVYNRDFWDGYYLGQKMGEWANQYGSKATKRKVYIGKVTNFFTKLNVAEIKIETGTLYQNDAIMIMGQTTGVYEDTVSELRLDLAPVEKANKGQYCSIPTQSIVHRGDKVYRLEDA